MPYQAELVGGIARHVTDTTTAKVGANFVPLSFLDASVIGKRWTGSAWESIAVDPAPLPLDEAALIDLCQSAGGMTDAQLVSAHNDANLAAFWIKLRAASVVLPTDPRTVAGLEAVDLLGYLPEGAAAVLGAWPTA